MAPGLDVTPMRSRMLLVGLLMVTTGLAGCATDGGDLRGGLDAPKSLQVTSPTVQQGASIPSQHTCDGPSTSPQIDITGLPDRTVTLALVVDDPDAPSGTFTHYLAWNAPAGGPSVTFPEDRAPQGAHEGVNSAGTHGYTGPCPPVDDEAHRYRFQAYAVDAELSLQPGAGRAELADALDGRVQAWGELVATYERAG